MSKSTSNITALTKIAAYHFEADSLTESPFSMFLLDGHVRVWGWRDKIAAKLKQTCNILVRMS